VNAEDRIALILGRAIMRAEALHAQLEQAQQRLAEHETGRETVGAATAKDGATS